MKNQYDLDYFKYIDTLEKEIWSKPVYEIAKDLGISDVMVHKYCKIYDIKKPPQGYWLRK